MATTSKLPGYAYQIAHIDETKQPATIAAASIMIVITTLAVTGRLVAQRMIQPRLLADDYCVIVALILSLGLCATLIVCVKFGLGLHVIAVINEDPNTPFYLTTVFKTGYAISVAAIPDLFFIKASLILFYRRIFTTRNRRFKIALYLVGGYVTAWTIGSLIVFIIECTPISLFWDRAYALAGLEPPTKGSCLPTESHQAAPGVLNTVSDLLILVLPGVALWPLQMRKTKKIGLFFIFSLGAFVCGVSIAKIVYVFTVSSTTDSTYLNTEILLWTVVECCIGLLCACLPCMVPLTRIFTMGPRAAFKYHSSKNLESIPMKNREPPFKGGCDLHSRDDDEWILRATTSFADNERTDGFHIPSPVDGEGLAWTQDGSTKNTVTNQAFGSHRPALARSLSSNTIHGGNEVVVRSEGRAV